MPYTLMSSRYLLIYRIVITLFRLYVYVYVYEDETLFMNGKKMHIFES